jgi:hypothetical protein
MAYVKKGIVSISKFKISGFKQLEKGLNELTDGKFRVAALRAAGKAALTPLKEALVDAAPILKETSILPTGSVKNALKDSIRLRQKVNKNPKLSKNKKRITNATKSEYRGIIATGKEAAGYAIVSEYGRKQTTINRYSAFGKVTAAYEVDLPKLDPKPWIRPTFDKNVANVLFRFRRKLAEEITKKAKAQERKRKRAK